VKVERTRRNIIRAGALLVSGVVANVAAIKTSVAGQNGPPGQGRTAALGRTAASAC